MTADTNNTFVAKRILGRVLIVVALYPILLGGVANMPQRYRARWLQMRQEHRDAVARDRARKKIREAAEETTAERFPSANDSERHGNR